MSRASDPAVRKIIQADSTLDIGPFIEAATTLVDYVDGCDTGNTLSKEQLKQIEIWVSAHLYATRDQQYSAKKTLDASAKFQVGAVGTGSLDITSWGRQAMLLDTTGCLSNLNEQAKTGKRVASASWLGKPPSDQTDYEDRD